MSALIICLIITDLAAMAVSEAIPTASFMNVSNTDSDITHRISILRSSGVKLESWHEDEGGGGGWGGDGMKVCQRQIKV